MSNEADTCRKYVLPRLRAAGWSDEQIREQFTFTAGQIMVSGGKTKRGKPKRADYLLRYKRDYHLAVVEAKADYRSALDGMQQAKDYAARLGLLFAYSTNGKDVARQPSLLFFRSAAFDLVAEAFAGILRDAA